MPGVPDGEKPALIRRRFDRVAIGTDPGRHADVMNFVRHASSLLEEAAIKNVHRGVTRRRNCQLPV